MQAEIEKLLHLQELDTEVHRLEKELEHYPGLRQAREEEVARTRKRLAETTSKRRETEKQIRETERNVTKLREDLRKFAQQQERVKNQKEYDALTHEIAETHQKISDEEEKGLALLTEEERLDEDIATLEKNLNHRLAEAETETERLNEREGEKKHFLAALLEERSRKAALLDQTLVQRYERLRGQYPANAVVPVQEGNCGGCFMRILARTLQDIQREGCFAECTSCHRILYIP